MHLPLLSVITVCLNAELTLKRAIKSVESSSYPNLEYIIIDGGSTDGTLQIIDEFRNVITKVISEPDEGISDALNKGIARSTGEFHYLLHADDELFPNGLNALYEGIAPEAMVVGGRVAVMDKTRLIRIFRSQPEKLPCKMALPHMGCLIRKSAWNAAGHYDCRRKIAMDHLLMLRILKLYGISAFSKIEDVVARHNVGGISAKQLNLGFAEVRDNLLEEGYGFLHANYAFSMLVLKGILARHLVRPAQYEETC